MNFLHNPCVFFIYKMVVVDYEDHLYHIPKFLILISLHKRCKFKFKVSSNLWEKIYLMRICEGMVKGIVLQVLTSAIY